MLIKRPRPSVVKFNKLLTSVVKSKQYAVAFSLFDKRRILGVPFDECTLNIATNCCCRLNRVDLGFAVLGMFFKYGYVPTTSTFSTLIKGFFLANDAVEAKDLFKKVLREKFCEPNEVMFLVVIDGLCKTGNTITALDLLDRLERGNYKLLPRVKAYSTLIYSLCKDKMVDAALNLFKRMTDVGIAPDMVMYNSMIQVLCNSGELKQVINLLNEMDANKISCDLVTFNILVDAFCKKGKMEEAECLVEIMIQMSIGPDIVTYNTLIDGYCLQGAMEKAISTFDLIVDSGLEPNIVTYATLINGYNKKGNIDEAWQLFLEVPEKKLTHTIFTYNLMVFGLLRGGRVSVGWELFSQMQAYVTPNLVTYNMLLYSLCLNHQIYEAFSVLCMMEDSGVNADITLYNTLIHGLCKDRKLHIARNIFSELPAKGLQPDAITYTVIIGALVQEGLMLEAENEKMWLRTGSFDLMMFWSRVCSNRRSLRQLIMSLRKWNSEGIDT